MLVSMSRTIGNEISPTVSANCGTGPTLIIWWTAGLSGIDAPAIRAIRGLQTPQAMTTTSASMSPLVVRTVRMRPSTTSRPVTSVPAAIVSAPISTARSRMIVPARSESTTPTDGVWKPPRITLSSRYGTSALTPAGSSSSDSMPHDRDDAIRRVSSCIRSVVRATSMPPLCVKTPSSWYWTTLSSVSAVISLEWSVGKMKFDA